MWAIVGQNRAVSVMDAAVGSHRVPHALLLTGPSGVGKTRLALEVAKALNCVGDDAPCQTCLHCRQIESGSHPDVSVMERPEGKDSITIQQVRELRDVASLKPYQGRFKVYIVSGAEALTPQAADALLKTLEEPQPQVVMILTALDTDALPATVVSRCRVLPLQAVDAPTIVRALQEQGEDVESAERLARLARGSVGWAVRASKQPKLVTQQEELVARVSGLMDMDMEARLQLAESLTADKKDRSSIRRSVELLLVMGRDLLLVANGLPAQLAASDQQEQLAAQAMRYGLADVYAYLHGLETVMRRIDQNVDPRLALEALFVNLP